MGEQPSGLVALCGFRLSIIASKAIPAVIIEMGQANSVHRWQYTVRGMVDPIAQIFLCLYVV